MAYVGTPIDTRNTFQSLQGKRFNGDGSTTAFTLDVAPSSTLDIEVFVENVRQDPNSAYNLSGTTLTFTGAPPSGTNNIYVVHQAKSVGTIDVPNDSVTANSIVDDAVESEHLNNNIISGQTALAATPADTDEFLISDAGTIKRIDYSYIKAANTPAFSARTSGSINFGSSDGYKKVAYSSEDYDTDSAYDHSSNYRFTAPSAGKWHITVMHEQSGTSSQTMNYIITLYKNGSALRYYNPNPSYGGNVSRYRAVYSETHTLAQDDYLEVYCNGGGFDMNLGVFQGFKLIGV